MRPEPVTPLEKFCRTIDNLQSTHSDWMFDDDIKLSFDEYWELFGKKYFKMPTEFIDAFMDYRPMERN